jgi:ATP-dependent exoDNAse (exonuclease V) beta subunit
MVHATIDRTFLDEAGVRWIVDYKTSSPAVDEPSEHFISAELDRYHNQLQLYATLSGQLEPGRALRTALYFPRFDGWIEVGSKTTDKPAKIT